MIKYILMLTFLVSMQGFAGGTAGGGGLGKASDLLLEGTLLESHLPSLGLPVKKVTAGEYRRTIMRLSVSDSTTVRIKSTDELLQVKSIDEAITDIFESVQILPDLSLHQGT